MSRHAPTILCQILSVRCVKYLATSFVAICQPWQHVGHSPPQSGEAIFKPPYNGNCSLKLRRCWLLMSVRPATWFQGRTCEHKPLPYFIRSRFGSFHHALQSPEAAAVFSPSLGVGLLLLIWGIAPGIELHRFRHSSQRTFLLEAFWALLIASLISLKREGEREREREG